MPSESSSREDWLICVLARADRGACSEQILQVRHRSSEMTGVTGERGDELKVRELEPRPDGAAEQRKVTQAAGSLPDATLDHDHGPGVVRGVRDARLAAIAGDASMLRSRVRFAGS